MMTSWNIAMYFDAYLQLIPSRSEKVVAEVFDQKAT